MAEVETENGILGQKRSREEDKENTEEPNNKKRKTGEELETLTGEKRIRRPSSDSIERPKKRKKTKRDDDELSLRSARSSDLSSSFSSLSSFSSSSSDVSSISEVSSISSASSTTSKTSKLSRKSSNKGSTSPLSNNSLLSSEERTIIDAVTKTISSSRKSRSSLMGDDDDAFSEISFSTNKEDDSDSDLESEMESESVASGSSNKSRGSRNNRNQSSRRSQHFDSDGDEDEEDEEERRTPRRNNRSRNHDGDGLADEDEKKWVPCIAPDRARVLDAFGPPPPREDCFACRKSSPKEVAFASEPFNCIKTMISELIHYSDPINLTEQVYEAFETRVRAPSNAKAANDPEKIPIAEWTKASIHAHITDHMMQPDFVFHHLIRRLKSIVDNFIDTRMFELNTQYDEEGGSNTIQYRVRTTKAKDEVNPLTTLKDLYSLMRVMYSCDPKKMFGYNEDLHINIAESKFANPEKPVHHRGTIPTNMHTIND